MCIAIPPKDAVVSVSGFLKGESAMVVARQLCGKERNFTGEHLWARGYAVLHNTKFFIDAKRRRKLND